MKTLLVFLLLTGVLFAQDRRTMLDVGNSSTTVLDSAATFSGSANDVIKNGRWSSVLISVYADHDTNFAGDVCNDMDNSTLTVYQGQDGTNWDKSSSYTIGDSSAYNIVVPLTHQWYYVALENDTVAQSSLRLESVLSVNSNLYGRDKSTDALMTIDYAHHETHGGSAYEVSTYDLDFDGGDTMSVTFTTPDTKKWLHAVALMSSSATGIAEILESPTITAGADDSTTVLNLNRNSSNTSTVSPPLSTNAGQANIDAYITADGTPIMSTGVGAAKFGSGSSARSLGEHILKQNTTYSFRIIGVADNGVTSIRVVWYEHIDRIN